MLTLDRCTAICVDTANHILAEYAARRCAQLCAFERLLVLSDRALGVAHRRIARLDGTPGYNEFVLTRLLDHVETDHVLIFQWDGFVIHPRAWRKEFLDYDYVGAPWPAQWVEPSQRVGNGGFSLRSRRLLQAIRDAKLPFDFTAAEDVSICRGPHRQVLEEQYGIRFAPPELANFFSFEHTPIDAPTFGFHADFNFFRVLPEVELHYILRHVPQSFWQAGKPLRWIRDCWQSGARDLSRRLFRYCLQKYPRQSALATIANYAVPELSEALQQVAA